MDRTFYININDYNNLSLDKIFIILEELLEDEFTFEKKESTLYFRKFLRIHAGGILFIYENLKPLRSGHIKVVTQVNQIIIHYKIFYFSYLVRSIMISFVFYIICNLLTNFEFYLLVIISIFLFLCFILCGFIIAESKMQKTIKNTIEIIESVYLKKNDL